ncbi:hypothetical protein H4F05_06610 [Vibrio cholerae]
MNNDDIKPSDLTTLVRSYYVIQGVLISSPLGLVDIAGNPKYPIVFHRLKSELVETIRDLKKFDIQEFEALEQTSKFYIPAIQLRSGLKKGDDIIQPPENLIQLTSIYVQTYPTPWK